MGLLAAIQNTGISLWIQALNRHLREWLETVNPEPEVVEAMINQLNRAMEDLTVVARAIFKSWFNAYYSAPRAI